MSVMSFGAPRHGNTVGTVALALTILGGIVAAASLFVPAAAYVALAILLAAFVLSIVGLARWGLPKATSVLALVLSVALAVGTLVIAKPTVGQLMSWVQPRPSADEVSAYMMDYATTTFPMMFFATEDMLTELETGFDVRAAEIVDAGDGCMDTVRAEDGPGLKAVTREACSWFREGGDPK